MNITTIRKRASAIRLIGLCATLAVALIPNPSHGKILAVANRAVFKCMIGERTVYTDVPCIGTQLSGTERANTVDQPGAITRDGTNLQRDMEPPSNDVDRAVLALAHTPRAACPHLAQRMAWVEAEEQVASSSTIVAIQERLAFQRNRYRELGC